MSEILLIQPSEFFSGHAVLRNFVPTHLLLLGSCLRQEGIPVKISTLLEDVPGLPQDLKSLSEYYKRLVDYYKAFENASFVGISCYSSAYYISSVIIGYAIREALPDATIIVGGYGPNTTTEDFLFENSPFDYVFVGEADVALVNLVKEVSGASEKDRFPGKFGKPRLIECREIKNLDSLPPIDWTLLEGTAINKVPFITVPYYASRGCPFHCKYCCDLSNLSELGYHKQWRPKDVGIVIKELDDLHKFMNNKKVAIFFNDPLFGFRKNWKMEMVQSLITLAGDWKHTGFWIEERVDTLSEDAVLLYTKLDMAVSLGLENGSPRMLKLMNKTQNPEKYLEKMKINRDLFEKHKVHYALNVLFGFPGETPDDLKECQDYITELFENVHYGFPIVEKYLFYPGSYVYKNYQTPEFDGLNVAVPDWYKRMGNVTILPGMVDPSAKQSYLDVFEKVSEWTQELYKKLIRNFYPSPKGKIVYQALKTAYLERFALGWKYRPRPFKLLAEVMATHMPQLMPLGGNFRNFIQQADRLKDNHLEAMKEINIKLRNLT